MYFVPLGVRGRLNSNGEDGVSITMTRDDRTQGIDNPNNFFLLEDGERGIMIRLIRGIDRDVSVGDLLGIVEPHLAT